MQKQQRSPVRRDVTTPTCAASVLELLMHAGQDERPDGLIVTDDNMVEPALAGLRAAGVQPGTDLEIVAHGNFPRRPGGAVGVRWLGYDIRRLLRAALEDIDARRRGEAPAPATIPAQFEEEIDAAPPMPARVAIRMAAVLGQALPTMIVFLSCQKIILKGIAIPSMK